MQNNYNGLIEKKFRPEIEGVRALAALMVAVYHIWIGKVSGGVDVFFVISGFLITTTLISRLQYKGELDIKGYLLNLARRLIPLSFLVLFFIVIASYMLLPEVRWSETIKEFIATAFYYENWQLANTSVDYLANNSEQSPVQHYWAMSIQGQFYVIWAVVIAFCVLIGKYLFKNISKRKLFLSVLVTLFLISLIYSIYITAINQPWAYFDTFTRLWEFSLGGIAALTLPLIKSNKIISFILGWVGLFMLISTGILFSVSTVFPGFVALYPTIGALFIVYAHVTGGEMGVHKLLGSKPLVSLGGISYGIYLLHWPLLIFYLIYFEKETVPMLDGLIIILLSILISYVITYIVEKPIRKINIKQNVKSVFAILACFIIPTIILLFYFNNSINELAEESYEQESIHMGAGIYLTNQEIESVGVDEILPQPVNARAEVPITYEENCHQGVGKSEVIECFYGVQDDPEYTIALVGGSHSAHWLPALREIATENSIEINNITKSGCRFTKDASMVESDCAAFNENLMEHLKEIKPDLVFLTADIGPSQEVPSGYVEVWEELEEEEIPIFAIRDNGYFPVDPPTCIEENGIDSEKCQVEQEEFMPEVGAWEKINNPPENVTYFDTAEYFCSDGVCKSVIGNVLVYRDQGHITTSFSKTMAPIIEEDLMGALRDSKER